MSKQSFRNITISNNGVEERWKWRYGTKDTILMAPDGKKSYIPTNKLVEAVKKHNSDENTVTTVSPRAVAEYIYGLIGQPMPDKKPQVKPEDVRKTITKSKVYLIMKAYTFWCPNYPCLEISESVFEIYQDASKAKIREQELNAVAKNMYIADELADGTYSYETIIKIMENEPKIGYKFTATEMDMIV